MNILQGSAAVLIASCSTTPLYGAFGAQSASAQIPMPLESWQPMHRPPEGRSEFDPQRLPIIPEEERDDLRVSVPSRASRPGTSVGVPTAYGARWGNVGIGFGYQEQARFTNQDDGVIGISFGLGDPQKLVGVQLGLALVDTSDPFEDGSFSIKVHREIVDGTNIAIGSLGFATFGNPDGGSSGYGVITQRIDLREDIRAPFSRLFLNVGVGGGQFRSESDIDNGVGSVGVFGGFALQIIEPLNGVVEWTGQDLTLGLSYAPFPKFPLVITPAITDVTGTAGDGTRFVLGVGLLYSFK